MKNLILLASVLLVSCSSDELSAPDAQTKCNCKIITSIVINGTVNGNTMRTYTYKENCTGKITTNQMINTTGVVGDEICGKN